MVSNNYRLSDYASCSLDRVLSIVEDIDPRVTVGLTIRDYQDYTLRELSDYLEQVDRLFGRLAIGNLRSYSRSKRGLYVMSIHRAESFELFLQVINVLQDGSAAFLIGLLLAKLPKIIEALPKAYKTIEEARLIRMQRQEKEIGIQKSRQVSTHSLVEMTNAIENSVDVVGQKKIVQILKEVEVYQNLDEETHLEVAAAIHSAVLAELKTRRPKLVKAFIFNSLYLEKVVLEVRPERFDPASGDPRIRNGLAAHIEIKVEPLPRDGDESM